MDAVDNDLMFNRNETAASLRLPRIRELMRSGPSQRLDGEDMPQQKPVGRRAPGPRRALRKKPGQQSISVILSDLKGQEM
jgi:hypothetical protein